jgi:hypothetical protein
MSSRSAPCSKEDITAGGYDIDENVPKTGNGNEACTSTKHKCTDSEFNKDVTVLVVGETQSGKSTFIKFLHQVGGFPVDDTVLKTGDGNVSCTTEPHVFHLKDFQRQKCPLFEKSKSLPEFPTEEDKLNRFFSNTGFKAVPTPINASPMNLSLIDTAGFNDTNTGDEIHAFRIIRTLKDFPSITSVLFIVGKGTTYTRSFQDTFGLYKDILQGLRFVIVHTKWSPLDEVTDADYKKRKEEFEKLFAHKDEINFQHFFIDTVPGKKSVRNPFFEHKKALAYDSLDLILGFLQGAPPMATKDIKFAKTKRIKTLDSLMAQRLDSVTEGMTAALKRIKHESANAIEETDRLEKTIASAQAKKDPKSERLAYIDTNDEQEIRSDSVDRGGSFFGVAPQTLEIQTDHPIITHARCFLGDRSCEWSEPEPVITGRTRVYRTLQRNWIWAGISGTLTACSSRKIMHSAEIKSLEVQIEVLQEQIDKAKDTLEKMAKDGVTRNKEEQQFNAVMKFAADQRRQLEADFLPLEEVSESKEGQIDLLSVYLNLLEMADEARDKGEDCGGTKLFTLFCEVRGVQDLTASTKN